MSKALSSLCLVLLICFGGSAWADKPKIAVLGLEVTPGPGGSVDPATTQIAKDVTRELRQRAQSGASPYVLAPNSNKELTDEKLLLSCDNEAKDCMAVIGVGLAADVLLFGRVEKKGEIYRITLKLLDVKAKTLDLKSDEMPVGGSPVNVSKRLYIKLAGDAGGSTTLTVTARSQGGTVVGGGKVMIDDDRVGDLSSGKLTVTGVGEGNHVVAIEAGGFRRYQETLSVRNGQPAKLDAVLVERGAASVATASGKSNTLAWKVTLGAGIAVAAIGGGVALYSNSKMNEGNISFRPYDASKASGPVDPSDCGSEGPDGYIMPKNAQLLQLAPYLHACKWHPRIYYGFAIAGVGVVGALVSAIMLTRDPGPGEKQTAERSVASRLAITPVITPDQTGAALSFRW